MTTLFVLFFGLTGFSSLSAQTPEFDKLKIKFEQGKVFEAQFDHEFTDSYTGEILVSEGKIWIGENAYRLESEGQDLVVDGETSKVYDANRNRVIIDEYIPEDDDFAPSRLLQGLDSTYQISEQKVEEGTLVNLISQDDFSIFTQVEILLDERQNPIEITAYDISENVIVTTFENGTFTEPKSDLFELSYPEDAEVVDLRY